MFSRFRRLFKLYKGSGFFRSFWVIVRVIILPFKKIDKIVPKSGTIVDIGCGAGGFTNFLAISSSPRSVIGYDLSKKRINIAKKTVRKRKNIKFFCADVVETKIPRANCFLIVDVLHHISYKKQKVLLQYIGTKLKRGSILLIKEVDNSNTLAFLFGHFWEKVLYPKDNIYVRSKAGWISLLKKYGLKLKIESGAYYFPDSTFIVVARK